MTKSQSNNEASARRATAYHEAGHAVIGRVLGVTCGDASIKPNSAGLSEETFGYADIEDPLQRWERGDGSRRKLANNFCMALYAGAEAEKHLFGHTTGEAGDGVDQSRATACLAVVGVRGARFVQDDTWDRYEQNLRTKSRRLVIGRWSTIRRVADALLEHEELSAVEIDAIVRSAEPASEPEGRHALRI